MPVIARMIPPAILLLTGCAIASDEHPHWQPIARIKSRELTESSGLAPCRHHDDLLWSHNDSGHRAVLFAIDLQGTIRAALRVEGAENIDWEDMTSDGRGTLYLADFGDNHRRRNTCRIYAVTEPDPIRQPPEAARVRMHWDYTLPQGPTDAEAIFHHDDKLYLITKETRKQPTIYRLPFDDLYGTENKTTEPRTLQAVPVCTVPIAPVTAADVSGNGKQLAVLSYGQLAVFDLTTGIASVENQKPARLTLPFHMQTEACTFLDGDVIVTAESREIWRITRKHIEEAPRR